MDILTVAGIGLAIMLIFGPLLLDGSIIYFIDINSMVIVILGSTAAVFAQYRMSDIKNAVPVLKKAIFNKGEDATFTINLLVDLGDKARKEGILALERELKAIDNTFLRKAIQFAVDGNETEVIREVMETEIEYIEQRHKLGQSIFDNYAALAPAFGMIGTLVGLIQMLQNLDDPAALGPGMSVALVTTFYGAVLANAIFTPLVKKLQLRSQEELVIKQIILTGIVSIQSGDNPRVLRDKLETYIPPANRQGGEQG